MNELRSARRVRLGGTLAVIGALAFSALACGSADEESSATRELSQASVRTLGGGDLPFYARLERTWIYHDDDWALVPFYRPPACIPGGFNLLDFMDFGAFACTPATTDGFSIWTHGPGIDPSPRHVQLTGLGAVPVWFAHWAEVQGAVADGVLTIGELGALPSLLTGVATTYQENLHPLGAANVGKIEFQGAGSLTDGRSFKFDVMQSDGVGRDMIVHIHFK